MSENDVWTGYLTAYLNLKTSELVKTDKRKYWSAMQAVLKEAKKRLDKLNASDLHWLETALQNDQHKWFVLDLFSQLKTHYIERRCAKIPDGLFEAFVRASVYEKNPSDNRWYVEPCLDSFGYQLVYERLLNYLESGTDEEKAGAANALYWVRVDVTDERIADLISRHRKLLLKEFVGNEDLQVRKSILGGLSLDSEFYPDELKPLIPAAIEIARHHQDFYIRSRIEIQLGGNGIPKHRFPDDPK